MLKYTKSDKMDVSITVKGRFVNLAFVRFLGRINQEWTRECRKKVCVYNLSIDTTKATIELIYSEWGSIIYH